LRFGIGFQKEHRLVEWVLGEFTNLEKEKIEKETFFLLNSLVEWIKGKEWEKIVSDYKK
jgi:peptidyl-tRNA hydrolase